MSQVQNLVFSHRLRLLCTAGLATSRREGRLVMYALTDCCHQLLRALFARTAVTARPEAKAC